MSRQRIFTALWFVTLIGCAVPDPEPQPSEPCTGSAEYEVIEGALCVSGATAALHGVNALSVFGPDTGELAAWKVQIVREPIFNPLEQPITGEAILDSTGTYLHSLDTIIRGHRAEGRVTILCPFAWEGEQLLGESPSETPYWEEFQQWITTVSAWSADQPDVWIEVWNEPYDWQAGNQTDERWLQDMQTLVNAVRDGGNQNIVVVPGGRTGQGVEVIMNQGVDLMAAEPGIIFDVHFYERWLHQRSPEEVEQQLIDLDEAGIPFLIGELGPQNAGHLYDPAPYLPLLRERTVLAWLWKHSDEDANALLTRAGEPNDQHNYGWGSLFQAFLN